MRVALLNLGAEESDGAASARAFEAHTPLGRLATAFRHVVEHPPWPWLAQAEGLVPWLVTQAACERARAQQLPLWGPDPRIVRLVHDKAFAARAAGGIDPIAELVTVLEPEDVTPERIHDVVSRWPPWARARFTAKPRWGTSGRGRIPGVDGRLAPALDPHAPITSLVRRGGAIVEPWLARTLDLSSQWFIDVDGTPQLLGVTLQVTRGAGVYLGCDVEVSPARASAPSPDSGKVRLASGTAWDDEVVARASVVVRAAAAAGYRGPCGVDAFVYTSARGACALRGVVELNARFTAGLVALAHVHHGGLAAGQRACFRLTSDPVLVLA